MHLGVPKIRGKKAVIEYMTELAFAMVLYFALLIILLFFTESARMVVAAEVTADNAALGCQNNLLNFLSFDDNKEKLLSGYASSPVDYTEFKTATTNVFSTLWDKAWELSLQPLQETAIKISTDDEGCQIKKEPPSTEYLACEKTVTCSTFIPLPCTEGGACLMEVKLVKGYA